MFKLKNSVYIFSLFVFLMVVLRISFASLRYFSDLKFAPVFSLYLEQSVRDLIIAFIGLLTFRFRQPLWTFLLTCSFGSLIAGIIYRSLLFQSPLYNYLLPRPNLSVTVGLIGAELFLVSLVLICWFVVLGMKK
jgi:hypothetical protein